LITLTWLCLAKISLAFVNLFGYSIPSSTVGANG
jgi:hypothetical protein